MTQVNLNTTYKEILNIDPVETAVFNEFTLSSYYLLKLKRDIESRHPNLSNIKYKVKGEIMTLGDDQAKKYSTDVNVRLAVNNAIDVSYYGSLNGKNKTQGLYYEEYKKSTQPQYFLNLIDEKKNVTNNLVLLRVKLAKEGQSSKGLYMTFGYNGHRITVLHKPEYNNNIYIFAKIFFFLVERIKDYSGENHYATTIEAFNELTNIQKGGVHGEVNVTSETQLKEDTGYLDVEPNTDNDYSNFFVRLMRMYKSSQTLIGKATTTYESLEGIDSTKYFYKGKTPVPGFIKVRTCFEFISLLRKITNLNIILFNNVIINYQSLKTQLTKLYLYENDIKQLKINRGVEVSLSKQGKVVNQNVAVLTLQDYTIDNEISKQKFNFYVAYSHLCEVYNLLDISENETDISIIVRGGLYRYSTFLYYLNNKEQLDYKNNNFSTRVKNNALILDTESINNSSVIPGDINFGFLYYYDLPSNNTSKIRFQFVYLDEEEAKKAAQVDQQTLYTYILTTSGEQLSIKIINNIKDEINKLNITKLIGVRSIFYTINDEGNISLSYTNGIDSTYDIGNIYNDNNIEYIKFYLLIQVIATLLIRKNCDSIFTNILYNNSNNLIIFLLTLLNCYYNISLEYSYPPPPPPPPVSSSPTPPPPPPGSPTPPPPPPPPGFKPPKPQPKPSLSENSDSNNVEESEMIVSEGSNKNNSQLGGVGDSVIKLLTTNKISFIELCKQFVNYYKNSKIKQTYIFIEKEKDDKQLAKNIIYLLALLFNNNQKGGNDEISTYSSNLQKFDILSDISGILKETFVTDYLFSVNNDLTLINKGQEEYNRKLLESAEQYEKSKLTAETVYKVQPIADLIGTEDYINLTDTSLPTKIITVNPVTINGKQIFEISDNLGLFEDQIRTLLNIYNTQLLSKRVQQAVNITEVSFDDLEPNAKNVNDINNGDDETTLGALKKLAELESIGTFSKELQTIKATANANREALEQKLKQYNFDNDYLRILFFTLAFGKINYYHSDNNSYLANKKLYILLEEIINTIKLITDASTFEAKCLLFSYIVENNKFNGLFSAEVKNRLFQKLFNIQSNYIPPENSNNIPLNNNIMILLYLRYNFRTFLEAVSGLENKIEISKVQEILSTVASGVNVTEESALNVTENYVIGNYFIKKETVAGKEETRFKYAINTDLFTQEQIDAITISLIDLRESVLGAARVYVLYRDTNEKSKGTPWTTLDEKEDFKTKMEKKVILKKSNDCVVLTENNKKYGRYAGVYNNATVSDITKLVTENNHYLLRRTILAEKPENLVFFGYGFSGSGKTYTLLNAGDNGKSSIMGSVISEVSKLNEEVIPVSLELSELYPFTIVDLEAKSSPPIINYNLSTGIVTESDMAVPLTENINLESIKEKINAVEEIRKSKMRITPTTNNPESSRSHLFISLKFNNNSRLTVIDMAGAEDVSQIKSQFINLDSALPVNIDEFKQISLRWTKIENFYTKFISADNAKNFKDNDLNALIKNIKIVRQFIKLLYNYNRMVVFGSKYLYTGITKSGKLIVFSNPNNALKAFILLTVYEVDMILSKIDMYRPNYLMNEGNVIVTHIPLNMYVHIIEYFLTILSGDNELLDKTFDSDRYYDFLKSLNLEYFPDYNSKVVPENFVFNKKEYTINTHFMLFLAYISKSINTLKRKLNILYNLILLKVILAYVNMVVKQGRGIVTTIEHLKYFFLSNTPGNRGIIKYNNSKSDMPDAKFDSRMKIASKIYKINDETVEMGFMSQYGMIQQLFKYGRGVSRIKFKDMTIGNNNTSVVNITTEDEQLQNGKYIMMAHINRGKFKKEGGEYKAINADTYKTAARLTLEFTNDITSMVGECLDEKPVFGGKNKTRKKSVKLHTKKNNKGKKLKLYNGSKTVKSYRKSIYHTKRNK
jgi:hypothetical protein